MKVLFRMPRFPVIMVTDEGLLGARTLGDCAKQLEKVTFSGSDPRPVIDSNAEGFALYPDRMFLSPLTMKKRWSKAEIIHLYNERKSLASPDYQPASLGNKTLERIVNDIVALLTKPSLVNEVRSLRSLDAAKARRRLSRTLDICRNRPR